MDDAAIRTTAIAKARSLMQREGEKFTVASLCQETGLSRAKLRRAFPTKARLISAVLGELLAESECRQDCVDTPPTSDQEGNVDSDGYDADSTANSNQSDAVTVANKSWPSWSFIEDEWIERRFRVVERAISTLELQVETRCSEQSASIATLEQKLVDVTSPPAVAVNDEPPPLISEPPERRLELESTETIQPGLNISPLIEFAPPSETDAPLGYSSSRLRLLDIMEKVRRHSDKATAANYRSFEDPRTEFLALAAAVFAALLTIAGLFWAHDHARATEPPSIGASRQARKPASIALIDATGGPQLNSSASASIASRLMIQANDGDPLAQTALAEAFLRGTGREPDTLAAARWSLAAAEQGEPSAEFILGTLYSDGIKPNARQAVKWYFAAASGGNVRAMHNLGVAFLSGQGVERDPAAASNWFHRAANAGYRDSAFDLAVLYERGDGVPQNAHEALRWYDKASSAGDLEARQRASFLRSNVLHLAEK